MKVLCLMDLIFRDFGVELINKIPSTKCWLSWLPNGGMSSPIESGQQKVYTSSEAN